MRQRLRQAEIREFQQRNWAEMKAAAERNKRQLMAKVMEGDGGADAGGEPAQEEDDVTVDDQDVADQAAMYEDMARIYRGWGPPPLHPPASAPTHARTYGPSIIGIIASNFTPFLPPQIAMVIERSYRL